MSRARGTAGESPMMQQYERLKTEAGDAILFFRLGDFYEMFHDDAVVASRALDITLTARGKDQDNAGTPMCGVPHHAAEPHVARLVRLGHRVAISEQVEDPRAAKGVVRREIVRIVTPATASVESALEPHQTSFLSAILAERGRVGLAHVDVSTGTFLFSEHDQGSDREAILSELASLGPREILVPRGTEPGSLSRFIPEGLAAPFTEVDPWTFSRQHARDVLAERHAVASLAAWGLDTRPAATRAVGAALGYLVHTQRADLAHVEAPRRVDAARHVALDPATRRNLEIVESLGAEGRGSTLAGVLDSTRTAMGGRTLRAWLVAPLRDVTSIDERLDAVAALVASPRTLAAVSEGLSGVTDLERLLARVVMGSAGPRDLAGLRIALEALPAVRAAVESVDSELLRAVATELDPHEELCAGLRAALRDDPPAAVRDGGFIREGHDATLDGLRAAARDGRATLARLESRERERTGISSLKVRHHKVFGYTIEISNANLARVPDDYQRKQTLAGGERYVTPELKQAEQEILHAHDRSLALEAEMFGVLRGAAAARVESLRGTARALGTLDALQSFAATAAANGYVRPRVDDSLRLVIRGGRHPVVERREEALAQSGIASGRFVPNDTQLDAEERQVVLLTGPNMGGKSTYLRQVALITLMAQAGSFVPADEAEIGVVDKIFTRVGAADSLATGQSTFMVEMTETARILHEATSRSLVILDEIGRGTATFDGLSIAWAVAERLHDGPQHQPRTLFATHYHELTELALMKARVRNLRLATREWNDEIVFLHRVEEGASDRSYGIQVARLAGLPAAVIARAREILGRLEANELDVTGRPRLGVDDEESPARTERRTDAGALTEPAAQMSLFGGSMQDPALRQLVERLAQFDVDGTSPREALDVLEALRRDAQRALEA